MIRAIDKEKTGCVTDQELSDIFKSCYPELLKEAEFKHLFYPFSLDQNRLLINYKHLFEYLNK